MISLILALVVLVVGFAVYGRFVEKMFGPDDRQTPAIAINDGVDCVPMKGWKAFLVQLLNIAGTGPIFGALMGACFGPVVFLWIVFGSILGGAVHDYMSGMISCRNRGDSIAELSGVYLGNVAKWVMRVFSIVLLTLTGTVFVKDGKEYRIPDKRVQSRQAYLSGLSFQGRIPQYKLRPAEGSLFDEPIALRTGEFRETCATCGSRLTCNGCSNCGACES